MAVDIIARALAVKSGETANAIIDAFARGFAFKGAVDYVDDLPDSGNSNGDSYIVKYSGSSGTTPLKVQYAWGNDSGTDAWIQINSPPTYALVFNDTTDWTAVDAATYAITVSAATHQRGPDATVSVLRQSTVGYSIITGTPTDGYTLSIDNSGNITLAVSASARFAGRIVIA